MSTTSPELAFRSGFARHGFTWFDAALALAAIATYFFADLYLALATQAVIMILFALSLDLALGYGGIETLGHAAFFGIGAYAAGLYALHVSPEPISGLVVAAFAAALVGLVSGLLVLRVRGLTQIMLTLAVATILFELGNTAKAITGGDNGLTGYSIAPLLGAFQFDLAGRTAYWYGVAVLAVVYLLCKVLVNSPFGLTVQGIRDNPVRMRMLGVPVLSRLLALYAIAGAFAGIAGGLSAQITRLVDLHTLSFAISGNVLVMLIIGGTARLYGAFLGAIVFVVLSDRAAAVDPYNWLFALGLVLLLVVRFAPRGLYGGIEKLLARRR